MELTDKGKQLIEDAKAYARGRRTNELDVRDVLLAICERESLLGLIAEWRGVAPDKLREFIVGAGGPTPVRGTGTLPLSDELRALLVKAQELAAGSEVDAQHIAEAAAGWQGLAPDSSEDAGSVPTLVATVRELDRVRAALLERVYGQDAAVHALVDGLFSCLAFDAADAERAGPAGVFLFVGPPGVGKTYLATEAASLLGRPFLRLDMSAYSGPQQGEALVGSSRMYAGARPGVLTGYVAENPDAVLLLDEVEKAHTNTLNLLLQILDAGTLKDAYTESNVSFGRCVLILTTNAGRQLYEKLRDASAMTLAELSRRTVLDALGTDKGPTGEPVLSGALLSRLGKGHLALFRSLALSDLQRVAEYGLRSNGRILEEGYGVQLEWDALVTTLLVLREGFAADARVLGSQVDHFVREELHRALRLADGGQGPDLEGLTKLEIRVDAITGDLARIAEPMGQPPRVLLLADDYVHRLLEQVKGVEWTFATTAGDALSALERADGEVDLALVDLFHGWEYREGLPTSTIGGTWQMGKVPDGAQIVVHGQAALREISQAHPSVPIVLLSLEGPTAEGPSRKVSSDLFVGCARRYGVREVLHAGIGTGAFARELAFDSADTVVRLAEELRGVCESIARDTVASAMQRERKVVRFDLVPAVSDADSAIIVRVRSPRLSTSLDTADVGRVLSDVERPVTTFADVIGADSAKEELGDVKAYLEDPRRFLRRYRRAPRGVLLHGPPGTGKTMLARALAGETGAAFIPSAASSFVTKWVGSGPQAVRDLFDAGRRYAPSIVFIDEVDSIGLERHGSEGSGRAEEETLNALLTEMDGFVGQDPARPVIVVAATNADIGERRGSRRALDPALVRRFSASVLVDLPSKAARALFLTRRLEGTAVSSGAIEAIADQTYGRTIADLQAIVDRAVRRQGRGEWVELGDQDLQDALGWWEHGDRRESWGPEMERRTAFHEAGHTLLHWLSSGRVPALVTVVPRGEHGGFMQRTTEDMEQPLRTREQLLGDLRVALGGRAAEALYAEKVLGVSDGLSTGAAGDLAAARRLALAYVTRYGMDDEFGVAGVLVDDEMGSPPKEVLDRVGALLREAEGSAEKDLQAQWERLQDLAQALLAAGSLSGEGLRAVLEVEG